MAGWTGRVRAAALVSALVWLAGARTAHMDAPRAATARFFGLRPRGH